MYRSKRDHHFTIKRTQTSFLADWNSLSRSLSLAVWFTLIFFANVLNNLFCYSRSLSLYLLLFRCAFCCDDDNDGGSNICRTHRTTWICWCHFIYWKSPIIVTNNLLLGAYRSQTDGLHSDRNYRDGRNETEIRREQERHTGRERDSRERARIHFLDTPFPNKVK